MILVMFAEDLVLNQVHLHSIGIAQPRQSTAEHYSIKTREPSLYIFFEFTDKLLHGVSPFVYCGFGTSNNVHLRRSASTVCGFPLCRAGCQPSAGCQSACCGAANPGCSRLSAGSLRLAIRRSLPPETLASGIAAPP